MIATIAASVKVAVTCVQRQETERPSRWAVPVASPWAQSQPSRLLRPVSLNATAAFAGESTSRFTDHTGAEAFAAQRMASVSEPDSGSSETAESASTRPSVGTSS
ncbi:MAG: hypothetical protein ACRDRI_04355 [Pseudonocardiaceae bacterium]